MNFTQSAFAPIASIDGMNFTQSAFAIIIAIIGISILIAIIKGKKTTSATLILTKFYVNEDDDNKIFVSIAGRGEGIITWLLTVLKIYGETTFQLDDDCISMNYLSMQGNVNHIIPLTCVASSYCGYSQSMISLILGILLSILGLLGLLISSMRIYGILELISGIILLIAFYFSKRLFISVETKGGLVPSIRFKRSIIGNIPVDFNKAKKVVQIIKNKTIEKTSFSISRNSAGIMQSNKITENGLCSNCGYKNTPESKFCEKCGQQLI